MIRVRDVKIRLGRVEIIRRVSFQVKQGEFFIIIGPNGSGKTTLLKGISGIVKLAEGEIRVSDRKLADLKRDEVARIMAVVPQHMPESFPFTVRETVLMGRAPRLGLLGIEGEADHKAAEAAMAFTDVSHLAGRRLDQLSGGESQRVIIARALCQEPEIILLDEPTAALDPAHQIRIMDLMDRMRHEQGITVCMVSHDLNLAAMYADRIMLLDRGRTAACGPPKEILSKKTLEQSYGCEMLVETSPGTGAITITPLPERLRG